MKNKKIILIISLIIIVVISGLFIFLKKDQENIGEIGVDENAIFPKVEDLSYFSDDQEVQARFFDGTLTINILSTEYFDVPLELVSSDVGEKYENKEKGLVAWRKDPELKIQKGDTTIFQGKELRYLYEEIFLSHYWVWETTYEGAGPDAKVLKDTPKKPSKFSLRFFENGTFSATTDCNSMSGKYVKDDFTLSFSEVVSTLMFCDASQEQIFSNLVLSTPGKLSRNFDSLMLETDTHTIIFNIGDKISK